MNCLGCPDRLLVARLRNQMESCSVVFVVWCVISCWATEAMPSPCLSESEEVLSLALGFGLGTASFQRAVKHHSEVVLYLYLRSQRCSPTTCLVVFRGLRGKAFSNAKFKKRSSHGDWHNLNTVSKYIFFSPVFVRDLSVYARIVSLG